MNAKEIYENALALDISYMEDEDNIEEFAIRLLNILVAEVFLYNNQIRQKKGKAPLERPSKVKSMDGEIDCEGELYAPLCYGLAAKMLTAQEETTLATIYNNQYVTLLEMVTPAVKVEVV